MPCRMRSVRTDRQTGKVFWALFTAIAGLLLVQVVDLAAAQKVMEIFAGIV